MWALNKIVVSSCPRAAPLVSTFWQRWAICVHYSQTGPWQPFGLLLCFMVHLDESRPLILTLPFWGAVQPVGTAMVWDSLLKNKCLVMNCWDVITLRLEIGGKSWGKGKQRGCADLRTCSCKVNVTTTSCSEPCTAFQAHLPPKWADLVC